MNARTFLPHKLDLGAFINEESRLEGQLPVVALSRLASGLAQDLDLSPLTPLAWWAEGRLEPQRVGAPQMWLDLHAEGNLPWECQRCLQPVFIPVTVDHTVRFVADEATAATLDAESEDDVLAISRQFDLLALIEDELILAQPIVPRHDECPTDVQSLMQSGLVAPDGSPVEESVDEEAAPDKPNPFAVLAALKKGGS
ncbi:YceD family protein [Aquabacterium sp.]|uniref:YceD family protein n=1 Tax=Aquabacterium sp. TaxID=1872578 RepID=UPI003D6DA40E